MHTCRQGNERLRTLMGVVDASGDMCKGMPALRMLERMKQETGMGVIYLHRSENRARET